MCFQQRLRSDCAEVQSHQGLRCLPEEALPPQLCIKHTVKTLITDWMDTQANQSLGRMADAQVILLILSCSSSYVIILWKIWLLTVHLKSMRT